MVVDKEFVAGSSSLEIVEVKVQSLKMFGTPLAAKDIAERKALWLAQDGALERKPKTLSLSSKEFETEIVSPATP